MRTILFNLNTFLEWLATFIIIGGGIATALSIDPLNIYLFNLGSVVWLIWAVRVKRTSLVVVNISLLLIYTYGFIVRM